MLYPSYSTVYVRRTLCSMARDNSIVLAFLTVGKMQSTINQLKYGKDRAVRTIMVLRVVLYHYCTYSTSFRALTNTYSAIATTIKYFVCKGLFDKC